MIKRKRWIELLLFKKRTKRRVKKLKKHSNRKKNTESRPKEKYELVNFLLETNFKSKVKIHTNRRNRVEIPRIFSFIDNPNETIKTLKKIYYLYSNLKINSIYIDYDLTEKLDLCASAVMDSIILECDRYRDSINKPVSLSGRYNNSKKEIKNILEISGIVKHLGFQFELPDCIKKLDMIKSGESDLVATEVTNYFKECLATQNYDLNRAGEVIFSEMIGEVLNNCKLHSGKFKRWYTLGHYFLNDNYGECQIVIFNFGNTIYESLKSKSTSKETLESLNNISSKHKGFYKKYRWSEEALWSLYSLQDGVSRVRDSVKEPDRGTGTIKLIDSFQKIGKTADGQIPLMSVTSGCSSILFNDSYYLKTKEFNCEERQIIAFNNDNDLFKLPDSKNVRIINEKFPGTVISMKFYLDREYIKALMEE